VVFKKKLIKNLRVPLGGLKNEYKILTKMLYSVISYKDMPNDTVDTYQLAVHHGVFSNLYKAKDAVDEIVDKFINKMYKYTEEGIMLTEEELEYKIQEYVNTFVITEIENIDIVTKKPRTATVRYNTWTWSN
jgi:hypothetical protein